LRLRLAILAIAAVAALGLVPAASANHGSSGTKTYTLDKKLKKLTNRLAIGFMAQDLGKRLGVDIASVKAGSCKGSRRKKRCTYIAQDELSESLGLDTLYVAKGTIKLRKGGRKVSIKQTAKAQ